MQNTLERIIPTIKAGDEYRSKHGHYSFIVREINGNFAKIDRYKGNSKESEEIKIEKIITQEKQGLIVKVKA